MFRSIASLGSSDHFKRVMLNVKWRDCQLCADSFLAHHGVKSYLKTESSLILISRMLNLNQSNSTMIFQLQTRVLILTNSTVRVKVIKVISWRWYACIRATQRRTFSPYGAHLCAPHMPPPPTWPELQYSLGPHATHDRLNCLFTWHPLTCSYKPRPYSSTGVHMS